MSEYWISQGRRMCTYCKCWTADNKASINFHEQGKNHKENVKRKLDELRKKGIEDAKKRESESSDLAQIEKAALASLKKDLIANEGISSAYGLSEADRSSISKRGTRSDCPGTTTTAKAKSAAKALIAKPSQASASTESDWTTAYNEEGHLYYWNTVTNETSWYPPNHVESSTHTSSHTDQPTATSAVTDQPSNTNLAAPEPKSAVIGYGQWETVPSQEPAIDDYDLPNDSKNIVMEPEDIPLPPPVNSFLTDTPTAISNDTEPQAKFKTKRVSLGASEKNLEPVLFKKRKMTKQRNTRADLADD